MYRNFGFILLLLLLLSHFSRVRLILLGKKKKSNVECADRLWEDVVLNTQISVEEKIIY